MEKKCGWGRTVIANTHAVRPEFISDLPRLIAQKEAISFLSYGCGRSYGDEALNANGSTLITTRLNRFISFDQETLELVCESGVTLHDIQTTFLPKGIALITSPGTAFVTVGGAIANDVHGKNHDRVGSFGQHVKWFDLLLASTEIIRCSRSQNAAIFFATLGGLGLTGIITMVCLQLQRHPIAIYVSTELTATISALMTRLRTARDEATYSVAWLDLTEKNFGRGILSTGEPDETPLQLSQQKKYCVPNRASIFLNRFSMECFNRLYFSRAEKNEKSFLQTLPEFLYPLDAVQNWNHLYGKNGFYQFQCVIPDDNADGGIEALLNAVRASSQLCYLAVLKTLGSSGEGLLSFPLRGFTLALDFPNQKNIFALLEELAEITVQHQGRVYLAKDACLSAAHFAAMYPYLGEFRAVLDHIDPCKKWQSELAKRLQIRAYD